MSGGVTVLGEYPVMIEVPVAWGDMDAFQHVNNTVYFRWFESARIAYFERIGFLDSVEGAGVGPILVSTSCEFRKVVSYPDVVSVGVRVASASTRQFLMQYAVVSRELGAVSARGEGLIFGYDYRAMRRADIPPGVLEAIRELEGSRLVRDEA